MIPAICGLDLGSWTFKICSYANKTFEVLTNEANFRETPSLIGFTHNERLIGEEAINKIKSNYLNTIRAPLRLIGLEKSFDLCQQELKYATAKYQIAEELTFYVTGENESKLRVHPEQLVIAFLGRVKKMIQSHKLKAEHLYISVPSFLSQFERKIIKKCAEIAQTANEIHIIDDWLCLATEYSYIRVKELKASDKKNVIFVDFGYSKLSIFVIQFSVTMSKLLDCEHVRFIGSKNMDQLLVEYYDQLSKKQRQSQTSIFTLAKSYVKLNDHVEKHRKVLSANLDHQINVDSLIQDYDLSYLMKRDQFQKIITPVITEIKKAFANVKSRMPAYFKIHSIELLGGASRTPIIKTLISEIFNMEPSKSLNQSQAMAHGASVYAVKDLNILGYDYNVPDINLIDIFACWNFSKDLNYYGEDQTKYKHREKIFPANCYAPNEYSVTFSNEGPVEMYIYYGQETSRKTIGYIRFKTPNKIKFVLDSSKIVHVSPSVSTFDVCKFYDKKEQKWVQIKSTQKRYQSQEERIKNIYDLKNEYESKVYLLKNNKESYKDLMSYQDNVFIQNALIQIEEWIQNENNRLLGSEQDLNIYKQRSQQLIHYLQVFHQLDLKKQNTEKIYKKYQILKVQIEKELLEPLNGMKTQKLRNLLKWADESYEKMKESQWQGYYLSENSLDYGLEEIKKIVNG